MPERRDQASAANAPKIPYLAIHEAGGDRTLLYRFYDAKGQLLYVGITNHPHVRWAQHAHNVDSEWWQEVRVVHSEWHATRAEAEEAEKTAIYREKPLHNYSHNFRRGSQRRFRSMYLHPMARETFGDQPFTYKELAERVGIPYGTVTLYGRRLVSQGAFRKVGTVSMGPRSMRGVFVAVDVPPALASPVNGPLLELE